MSTFPPSPLNRPPRGWRFSLGSIMAVMTLACATLGLLRAIPMSDELRAAMLGLAGAWALATLVAIAPGLQRLTELRRRFRQREVELAAWSQQQRDAYRQRNDSSATPNGNDL